MRWRGTLFSRRDSAHVYLCCVICVYLFDAHEHRRTQGMLEECVRPIKPKQLLSLHLLMRAPKALHLKQLQAEMHEHLQAIAKTEVEQSLPFLAVTD